MKFVLEEFGEIIKEQLLEDGQEYLIGRSSSCDFVLKEKPGLSREHIKIYQPENNWVIEVLSESSKLYFTGEETSSLEITQSCSLTLQNYVLKFISEEEEQKASLKEKNQTLSETQAKAPVAFDEATQVVASSGLLCSLHVCIDGEFSDYINLNLGESWTIGRSEECDICIDYDLLTRKHLQVLRQEGRFYVKDLGSANKTHLNGKEIPSKQKVPLQVNDEISVEDLKIVFEVRNTDFEKVMKNLLIKASSQEETSPAIAQPKVVLEDFSEEPSLSGSGNSSSQKKIFLVMAVVFFGVVAGFSYMKYEKRNKKVKVVDQEKEGQTKILQIEALYNEAQESSKQGEYLECISQLEELHQIATKGYHQDSHQRLLECQTGKSLQQQKKAEEALKKQQQQTETEIKKLVSLCQEEYKQGKITTVAELNKCAEELFNLQPDNAEISAIKLEIEQTEIQKTLEMAEKDKYGQWIQSKKALYKRAKKLKDAGKTLKAVVAYNAFLKATRSIASLKKLHNQAKIERDMIQKSYDEHLETLYTSCETYIQNKKFKQAYFACKKIRQFKDYDEKSLRYIEQAKSKLREEIKPHYEKSQWHENFSEIDQAKKIWEQILETDIKGGYYYKKAHSQLKKYD